MTRRPAFLFVLGLLATAGCAAPRPPMSVPEPAAAPTVEVPTDMAAAESAPPPTPAARGTLPVDEAWVERTLAGLTLDQKLGQLMMPAFRNLSDAKTLIDMHVGGFIGFFGNAATMADRNNQLQAYALGKPRGVPLLIAADAEKGVGTYVDGATDLPSMMALGATRSTELAGRAGALIAKESLALGITVDFAPVLDVNNNPNNPIINVRSFGENPQVVADLGQAYIVGLQQAGVLATAKHFPGHGNTATDSHSNLGAVPGSLAELNRTELFPYRQILRRTDLGGIMSAHLWIQAIDSAATPATLSPRVMTGLIRNDLNFNGVVFTDAMVMGGITKTVSFEGGMVGAIRAGCDVLLMPAVYGGGKEDVVGGVRRGIDALKAAVGRGELTEDRINRSVRRILLAKSKVGLSHGYTAIDTSMVGRTAGGEAGAAVAWDIARAAVTLVKNDQSVLPLTRDQSVLVIAMTNSTNRGSFSRQRLALQGVLKPLTDRATYVELSPEPTAAEIQAVVAQAGQVDRVVVAGYLRVVISRGTVALPESHVATVRALLKANPKLAFVSFGSPYALSSLPEVPAYVAAYDNSVAIQRAAAEAMFGRIPFVGHLPVTLSPTAPFGTGLTLSPTPTP